MVRDFEYVNWKRDNLISMLDIKCNKRLYFKV